MSQGFIISNSLTSRGATSGAPKGIRILVAALKGLCPGPLDDGGLRFVSRAILPKKPRKVKSGFQLSAPIRFPAYDTSHSRTVTVAAKADKVEMGVEITAVMAQVLA